MTWATTGRIGLAGIGIAAALLGSLPGPAGTAHAATILRQAPCVSEPDDFCVSFGASGPIPEIRRRAFDAPGPGTAVVTFHGSLTCANFTGTKGSVLAVSRIVTHAAAEPSPRLRGGLIHTATIPPQGSASFNLASTRVFEIPSAGRYSYIFKVQRISLIPGPSECRVYNASFTIAFEPAAP